MVDAQGGTAVGDQTRECFASVVESFAEAHGVRVSPCMAQCHSASQIRPRPCVLPGDPQLPWLHSSGGPRLMVASPAGPCILPNQHLKFASTTNVLDQSAC